MICLVQSADSQMECYYIAFFPEHHTHVQMKATLLDIEGAITHAYSKIPNNTVLHGVFGIPLARVLH